MNAGWFQRGLARLFWRWSGWRVVREQHPPSGPRLLIGAPHTSNFDFLLMLAIAWDAGLKVHWLGKNNLFRGLGGPLMRALGGISVDRKNASTVVDEVLERATQSENFILVVTPEGTRSGSGWRSGFYRIAWGAGLPVTLGFADGSTKRAGLGPTLRLSGDVEADMDAVREFYRDISGVRPELRTEPRMRDEAGLTRSLRNDGRAR